MPGTFAELLARAGAAGGAGLGGLLGQVGGVLDAPRQALWGALGLPATGSEALEGSIDNPILRQLLGLGLEVATDPLTLLGGIGGRLGGGFVGGSMDDVIRGRRAVRPFLEDAQRKHALAEMMNQALSEATQGPQIPYGMTDFGRGPVSLAIDSIGTEKAGLPKFTGALNESGPGGFRLPRGHHQNAYDILEGFGLANATPLEAAEARGFIPVGGDPMRVQSHEELLRRLLEDQRLEGPPRLGMVPGLESGAGGWTRVTPEAMWNTDDVLGKPPPAGMMPSDDVMWKHPVEPPYGLDVAMMQQPAGLQQLHSLEQTMPEAAGLFKVPLAEALPGTEMLYSQSRDALARILGKVVEPMNPLARFLWRLQTSG